MIPVDMLQAAMSGPYLGGVKLRVRGSIRARLSLWFLGWGPRLLRLSEMTTTRELKWALARVHVERQVMSGGPWIPLGSGWDYVRQAR